MGVDLGELCVKKSLSLESLSGKTIAIDAFNTLYQFLSSIRQEDGKPLMDLKGNITAHLSGLFYRNIRMSENGIKCIYVFDGKPSYLKMKTRKMRAQIRENAEKKWKEALELGNISEARKFAQASIRLDSKMIEESKELLSAMGIPWFVAPSEGEAEAASMVRSGIADASASQDYDSLLFGAEVFLRNISISGRRKVPREDRYILVEPEEIRLTETLKALEISYDQLVILGLLIGTDFNEGVPRVGPKTALKIVREHKSLNEIISYVKEKYSYEFEVDPQEVMDIFMKPEISEGPKINWTEMNLEKINKILVDDHDFSASRVQKSVEDFLKIRKEKGSQKKLDQWF